MAPSDVANIPPIALSIPDFEGEAILRIYSNTTREQIACYSAVVTNGNSFSHIAAISSILGIFTFVAMIASFATAAYGASVPTMRLHHAHSLSVGVIFAVFQHIFFSGALSLNWPSVLVAWWSNFAWAGGIIFTEGMQRSIDSLIGNAIGNTSQVGAAEAGSAQSASFGGNFQSSQIYGRSLWQALGRHAADPTAAANVAYDIYGRHHSLPLKRDLLSRTAESLIARRLHRRDDLANSSTGFNWYGHPIYAGLPLPGNYSGFAGTLSQEEIRLSNAFMTALLWFLVLFAILTGAVIAFKWLLEGLIRIKFVRKDCLQFFRNHWRGYTALVALRTCYIAFFMMMFYTTFQFTYESNGAVKGIAAIIFLIFFFGLAGAAFYAVQYRTLIAGQHEGLHIERETILGCIPWPVAHQTAPLTSPMGELDVTHEQPKLERRPSFWKRSSTSGFLDSSNNVSVHDDDDYISRFGWLTARFRRTRWWFFSFWLFYEFVRAIFYGGAAGEPLAQVFGLLIVEIFACIYMIWMRPFEGQRLNVIVVYCLGFSKVMTVALSIAFDVRFNVGRIITTAIGMVIIVIQGILTIITMMAIIFGAITSYMSLSRNQEDFRPRKWAARREKYFDHLDRVVNDLPRPPRPKKVKPPKEKAAKAGVESLPPPIPVVGFEMKNVRRLAKIEDEDAEFMSEMGGTSFAGVPVDETATPAATARPIGRTRANSGAQSISSARSITNLPYGARPHRPSWSTKDFAAFTEREGNQQAMVAGDGAPVTSDDDAGRDSPVAKKGVMRAFSRNSAASRSVTALRAADSSESLRVDHDAEDADLDTLRSVPAPTMRPRAGTGTRTLSRGSFGLIDDASAFADRPAADLPETTSRPSSQRASWLGPSPARPYPLTPAQEMEEWMCTPNTAQQAEPPTRRE